MKLTWKLSGRLHFIIVTLTIWKPRISDIWVTIRLKYDRSDNSENMETKRVWCKSKMSGCRYFNRRQVFSGAMNQCFTNCTWKITQALLRGNKLTNPYFSQLNFGAIILFSSTYTPSNNCKLWRLLDAGGNSMTSAANNANILWHHRAVSAHALRQSVTLTSCNKARSCSLCSHVSPRVASAHTCHRPTAICVHLIKLPNNPDAASAADGAPTDYGHGAARVGIMNYKQVTARQCSLTVVRQHFYACKMPAISFAYFTIFLHKYSN